MSLCYFECAMFLFRSNCVFVNVYRYGWYIPLVFRFIFYYIDLLSRWVTVHFMSIWKWNESSNNDDNQTSFITFKCYSFNCYKRDLFYFGRLPIKLCTFQNCIHSHAHTLQYNYPRGNSVEVSWNSIKALITMCILLTINTLIKVIKSF